MVKTRIIPLAAAMLILALLITPFISLNANASGKDIYEGVKTKSGTYNVALLDADFYDSKNGCLTSSQEAEILDLMAQTAGEIKCNIGIVITNDLGGKNYIKYTEDFNAAMFGAYSDSVSLLLLNRHGNAQYINAGYTDYLFLVDRGDDLFAKKAQQIFDRIYKATDKDPNDLYGACKNFCAALDKYSSGLSAVMPELNVSGTLILFMLAGSTVMSVAIVGSYARGYKKKTPISAAHYIDKSRTRINRQVDQFIREYTTSVHIDSSSGGHGGHSRGGGHSGGHHSSGHGGRGR